MPETTYIEAATKALLAGRAYHESVLDSIRRSDNGEAPMKRDLTAEHYKEWLEWTAIAIEHMGTAE